MRRRLWLLLALAAPFALAAAQRPTTGVLVGRVFDAQTRVPIAGAELIIASRDRRTTTDSSGEFRLAELPGGVHAIQVRRIGYREVTQDVSVIIGAESDADFRLTRVQTLDTVETRAAAPKYFSPGLRGFEERRKEGHGYFIPDSLLRKSENRTVSNLLRGLPGIKIAMYNANEFVAAGRSGPSGRSGALAGSGYPRANPSDPKSPRGCWASVYLDGVNIYNSGSGPAPDLARLQTRELAGIEYYPSTASLPAQFSAIREMDCGVILLWTRER